MPLLPNADFALIPIEKLRDYALNPDPPIGKHKAAVFQAALDLTADHAEELGAAIADAILKHEAVQGLSDEFGRRYQVAFEWKRNEKKAIILTAWIIEPEDFIPRLTTCYIK
ncbi:MAG: DUF6883 domain-containing protein [Saprospiraceae bacterium]